MVLMSDLSCSNIFKQLVYFKMLVFRLLQGYDRILTIESYDLSCSDEVLVVRIE